MCAAIKTSFVPARSVMAFLVMLSDSVATARRLYHLPLISGSDSGAEVPRRVLADEQGVDLDNLYQARGLQYVDLQVGCPAQTQSAIITTESRAIGFPCSGCTNDCGEGSHLHDLFNQDLSTCFEQVTCERCLLTSSFFNSCQHDQCPVSMSYAEGSSWKGYEVKDMISVGGEDANDKAFPLHFGCQDDIDGFFENQIPDGIFGMNKHPGSAIMQWSRLGYLDTAAFSLCYNVREDVKKKSGLMVLGGYTEQLHQKPMVFAKDVGVTNFEVSVQDIRLRRGSGVTVSAGVNNTANIDLDGTDRALVASGTTCTYLAVKWRAPLKQAFEKMTGGKYEMFTTLDITAEQLDELPTFLFDLEGTEGDTVTVEYPPMRYMEKKKYGKGYDFCLHTESGVATLGNTFMSGHDVFHDIDNKRIGFAESSCEVTAIQHINQKTTATDGDKNPPSTPTVVALQTKPIHIRNAVLASAATSFLDLLYIAIAFCVVFVVFFLYYRHKHAKAINDGTEVPTPLWTSIWKEPGTKHAYQLSCISLGLTVFAISAGVALYFNTGSSLFLVLGLENCVDFLSSAVVLWRFFAPAVVTKELEAKLKSREKRASVSISMILVILGVAVWITAFQDVSRGQEEASHQNAALVISFLSVVFFSILTVFKFRYAKVLDSPSLYKDGLCSTVGTILSASLFVNTLIILGSPSAWWIDPAVAIICGLASLLYGFWTLHSAWKKDGMPILSYRWWLFDEGGAEEGSTPGTVTMTELSKTDDGEEREIA